ncbi:TetR/AcrR family transcriptional regulator C-terminal domain-containing protein [Carnobacteriaceae bacterium zg-84]|nr:hypothetical protein [Granulicatella sp. zg-84]QMI86416.1 TetR/AcrR family transcriptional regulator C-terminal domain-containing protein [Carnobacteriaceae bacterium zg-84]
MSPKYFDIDKTVTYFDEMAKQSKLIKVIFQLNLEGYSPYRMMQVQIEEEIALTFSQKYPKVNKEKMSLFCKLYASSVLSTVSWWIENYESHTAEEVVEMIATSMSNGFERILVDK